MCRRCGEIELFDIRLLTLRGEPGVFLNPPFGFSLGFKFAEVHIAARPRELDAPMAVLPDRH